MVCEEAQLASAKTRFHCQAKQLTSYTVGIGEHWNLGILCGKREEIVVAISDQVSEIKAKQWLEITSLECRMLKQPC